MSKKKTCLGCNNRGWKHVYFNDGFFGIASCKKCNRLSNDYAAHQTHETECSCAWWKATTTEVGANAVDLFLAVAKFLTAPSLSNLHEVRETHDACISGSGENFNKERFKKLKHVPDVTTKTVKGAFKASEGRK